MSKTACSIDFSRARSSWRLCISLRASEATQGANNSPRNPARSISARHSACSETGIRTAMSCVFSFSFAAFFDDFFAMRGCYTNRSIAAMPMDSWRNKTLAKDAERCLEKLMVTVYTRHTWRLIDQDGFQSIKFPVRRIYFPRAGLVTCAGDCLLMDSSNEKSLRSLATSKACDS